MIQVLLLAIALAMDAFAVAIGLGANHAKKRLASVAASKKPYLAQSLFDTALLVALFFGVAQGVMPLLGYLLGFALLGWLASLTPWIGCLILVVLGAKMIFEAMNDLDSDSDCVSSQASVKISPKLMMSLAIATSIDALAAGFTLNLLPVNPRLACVLIGLITTMLSFSGVYLGQKFGTWLEDKAEILGGVVLIGIGINMLF